MVINDLRRFIFIHIPKNAGNSITRLLLKHFDNSAYDDIPQHAALKWVGNNFPEKLLLIWIIPTLIFFFIFSIPAN